MNLNELTQEAGKLSRSEQDELRSRLHQWAVQEDELKKEADQKKLEKFAKAVRKAGILKELKTVKFTKQVRLTVLLDWEFCRPLHQLDGVEDVGANIHLSGRQEEVLDRLFKPQAKALRNRVYRALRRVNALAKEYGVEDLDYDSAVEFLWE